jgi:integrase
MIYIALENFFKFLSSNYSYKLNIDIKDFAKNKEEYIHIAKKSVEANKIQDIPKDYYNKLITFLIKAMRNNDLCYKERAIACIYIILSQTGLRISEVLSLEVGSLKSIDLPNLERKGYFLCYKDFKSSRREQEYMQAEIFANELTKEAFDVLIELREPLKNKKDNNFIYLPKTKQLPATYMLAEKNFRNLLYKYADFAKRIEQPYKELSIVKNSGMPVIVPTTKQFRVRVCTDLYERNVPLLYIKKYMNHLHEDMLGYYVRPKSYQQENAEYSGKILKELVLSEASLLGNDSKDIKSNIDNFIKNNKLNIETDIDSIINLLSGKFIIRAKKGGVCIKTSIRECSKDAR